MIKKKQFCYVIISTVGLCLTLILQSCSMHTKQSAANLEDLSTGNPFFTKDGKPTAALHKLLKATHISVEPTDTVIQIHEKTKAAGWQSKPGMERPDMQLPDGLKDSASHIITIGEKFLNLQATVYPKPGMHFDGVLYLGAAFTRIITRIEFYNQLVDRGLLRPDLKMYVLTGDRKASPEKFGESPEAFLKFARERNGNPSLELTPGELPTNELEIIKFVFKYIAPKAHSVEYIYSPKDATHTRATTDSTMVSFLDKVTEGGTFVAISNQPYVDYQQSVLALRIGKLSRHDVHVYTVGAEDTEEAKESRDLNNYAAIILDSVGKIIGNLAELEKLKD
jgi:hypothetical protein